MRSYAGHARPGPFLAEAADVAEDGARINRAHSLVGEAKARERAGAEVLDDDIGPLDEPFEHAFAIGVLEIDRHAALVAIDREVVGRDAPDAGRQPFARLVTGPGHLHLDHIRAVVAEHQRAVRTRERAREVEHAHAVQCSGRRWGHARRGPLGRWRSCFRFSRSPPCGAARGCCASISPSRATPCWCGAAWTKTVRSASS